MPTGPAGPCSPFAPGGPAGPSKQPPSDNARPQAMADTKMRVLMFSPWCMRQVIVRYNLKEAHGESMRVCGGVDRRERLS
jgi:hypothetical protein